jgi:hypothetical protein
MAARAGKISSLFMCPISRQDPARVLLLAGMERLHKIFQLLAKSAIAKVKAGDKGIAYVDLTETWEGN